MLSIKYINSLKFRNQKDKFAFESGFVLRDGTLASYKPERHIEIANTLINYYSINNKEVNDVLEQYDVSCFEDILVALFGFLKVGIYGNIKNIEYNEELLNDCLAEILFVYERLGFTVCEYKPSNREYSKKLLLNLRK